MLIARLIRILTAAPFQALPSILRHRYLPYHVFRVYTLNKMYKRRRGDAKKAYDKHFQKNIKIKQNKNTKTIEDIPGNVINISQIFSSAP